MFTVPKIPDSAIVDLIELPAGCIPLEVDMCDFPGRILTCKPNENLFLFTDGLRTCLAIILYTKLRDETSIIGLCHTAESPLETFEQANEKQIPLTAICNKDFNNEKVYPLLVAIKQHKKYSNEPISVYVTGGWGDDFGQKRSESYLRYIQYLKNYFNLEIKGAWLDAFQINRKTEDKLDASIMFVGASLTAGISSKGDLLISKSYPLTFGHDAKHFTSADELNLHCKKNNIHDQSVIKDPKVKKVKGFKNLTVKHLKEYTHCFIGQHFHFQLNPDLQNNKDFFKNDSPETFQHCSLQFRYAIFEKHRKLMRTTHEVLIIELFDYFNIPGFELKDKSNIMISYAPNYSVYDFPNCVPLNLIQQLHLALAQHSIRSNISVGNFSKIFRPSHIRLTIHKSEHELFYWLQQAQINNRKYISSSNRKALNSATF